MANGDEIATRRVREFMANEVAKYIVQDLERLITETWPRRDGTGGLAVPLGLTCFAIMDYFGFLTRRGSRVNKRQGSQNILFFVDNWLPKPRLGSSPAVLTRIFRHGMTHQFFAKASGITRGDRSRVIVRIPQDIPVLNVDALADAVLDGLRSIDRAVSATDGSQLALRMNQRLDQLIAEDYQELSELLNNP